MMNTRHSGNSSRATHQRHYRFCSAPTVLLSCLSLLTLFHYTWAVCNCCVDSSASCASGHRWHLAYSPDECIH